MSSLVVKDIALDAVCLQFEPYLAAGCVWMLVVSLWCDQGCCSQTVVVITAAARIPPYASIVAKLLGR